MRILSIETSCDDTAISIMEANGSITNASFKILANTSNSQINIHQPYGGVYPVLAKREHAKNLPILLKEALKKLEKTSSKTSRGESSGNLHSPVDAIAVTYGPGLEMCLWEGIIFSKKLAKEWSTEGRIKDVPIVPVNHMEGHVLSVFGKDSGKFKIPLQKSGQTPMLALLVSGGHTQLVLIKKWMQYEIIGETMDDAVGEAFDKVARMLGLPYPGGPHISKLAEGLRTEEKQNFSISLPRPMIHSKDFNFSFSGLKTAVLYLIRNIEKSGKKIDLKTKAQIALEFENAAIECLTHKTKKAIEKYGVKTLIVAGGVAANKHLKNEMNKITGKKVKLLFPTPYLSTDNSIMIGIAGYLNYIKLARRGGNKNLPKPENIKATGNLRL